MSAHDLAMWETRSKILPLYTNSVYTCSAQLGSPNGPLLRTVGGDHSLYAILGRVLLGSQLRLVWKACKTREKSGCLWFLIPLTPISLTLTTNLLKPLSYATLSFPNKLNYWGSKFKKKWAPSVYYLDSSSVVWTCKVEQRVQFNSDTGQLSQSVGEGIHLPPFSPPPLSPQLPSQPCRHSPNLVGTLSIFSFILTIFNLLSSLVDILLIFNLFSKPCRYSLSFSIYSPNLVETLPIFHLLSQP